VLQLKPFKMQQRVTKTKQPSLSSLSCYHHLHCNNYSTSTAYKQSIIQHYKQGDPVNSHKSTSKSHPCRQRHQNISISQHHQRKADIIQVVSHQGATSVIVSVNSVKQLNYQAFKYISRQYQVSLWHQVSLWYQVSHWIIKFPALHHLKPFDAGIYYLSSPSKTIFQSSQYSIQPEYRNILQVFQV